MTRMGFRSQKRCALFVNRCQHGTKATVISEPIRNQTLDHDMVFADFRERGRASEPAVYRIASIFRSTRCLSEENDMVMQNALENKARRAHIFAHSSTPGEEFAA